MEEGEHILLGRGDTAAALSCKPHPKQASEPTSTPTGRLPGDFLKSMQNVKTSTQSGLATRVRGGLFSRLRRVDWCPFPETVGSRQIVEQNTTSLNLTELADCNMSAVLARNCFPSDLKGRQPQRSSYRRAMPNNSAHSSDAAIALLLSVADPASSHLRFSHKGPRSPKRKQLQNNTCSRGFAPCCQGGNFQG